MENELKDLLSEPFSLMNSLVNQLSKVVQRILMRGDHSGLTCMMCDSCLLPYLLRTYFDISSGLRLLPIPQNPDM